MAELEYATWASWLYDWQALGGSLIAVGAAIYGVRKVQEQIRVAKVQTDQTERIAARQLEVSERHEAERLRRRYIAARATLPATLSGFMDFAQIAADGIDHIYDEVAAGHHHEANRPPVSYHAPPEPTHLISAIERMIEASNDPALADRLAELLSNAQVLHARVRGIARDLSNKNLLGLALTLEIYIASAAEIYAEADSLIAYARRETDDVPARPTAADVKRALTLMSFYSDRYAEIHRRLDVEISKLA